MNTPFEVALLWIAVFWLMYFGSAVQALMNGTYDGAEAKAKAVLTANLSLALLAFWVHWTVACALAANGFVMYFWAQHYFTARG